MGKRKIRCKYRGKKRVFHSNQLTKLIVEQEEEAHESDESDIFDDVEEFLDSSSAKLWKMAFFGNEENSEDEYDSGDEEYEQSVNGNRIIYLPALQAPFDGCCVCSHCKSGRLVLSEGENQGMAPCLLLTCDQCRFVCSEVLGKKVVHGKSNFFDINRKAVLAMRMVGRGLKGLNIVSCILDMPKPMTRHTYECHQKALCIAAAKVEKKSMETAAATVLAKRSDELCPDEIAVSTDGTWMRRGHSSLYGIQTVISYDTKQILDTCALSKNCKQCSAWKRRYQDGAIPEEEYGDWFATHADFCDINTSVSAPAMETEAAVKLWNRSVESHGLKYTTFIGDGDSKGFNAVVKAKPYDDTDIVKEECIGHIQKRLGKGLRELQKKLGSELLSDGKPLCGKGRLTDEYMDRLQNYYGIAIRSNVGSMENMYRATWASLCHR